MVLCVLLTQTGNYCICVLLDARTLLIGVANENSLRIIEQELVSIA